MSDNTPPPPYYAVLFTSRRTGDDPEGYEQMAERMVALAAQQPGFLGVESARGPDGVGITVSYWESLEAVRRWREHAEHRLAQHLGRTRWYEGFSLRVCRVEAARHFGREGHLGKVVSMVHTPPDIDPRPPDHYARVPLEAATLQAGRGIATDRKGSKPERQLNVMARETLEGLRAEGLRTGPGEMGEQIVVAGIAVDGLAAGTRLKLGDEAVIEVDKPRTGCDRLRRIQGCTPAEVAGRLGVMARVVGGGTVRVGDAVALVAPDRPGPDRGT
jgi:heme-degrading monooxygenase HmoA